MAVCLATRDVIRRLPPGWLGVSWRRGSFRLIGGFGKGGGGRWSERKPRGLAFLHTGSRTPSPPHLSLLTPTSSPSSYNTWGPQDPLLSQPAPPRPRSSHHHSRSESHRSPCREGRQRPGSPPGPSRPPRPPPARTPTSGARRARSGNRRGERAGGWRGRKPVRGPRWPRPQAFGCAHARGRGSAVPEPRRPPRGHRHPPRTPTPAAVLPTLGNRTLPPGSGFPKTPDLQMLRMAFWTLPPPRPHPPPCHAPL